HRQHHRHGVVGLLLGHTRDLHPRQRNRTSNRFTVSVKPVTPCRPAKFSKGHSSHERRLTPTLRPSQNRPVPQKPTPTVDRVEPIHKRPLFLSETPRLASVRTIRLAEKLSTPRLHMMPNRQLGFRRESYYRVKRQTLDSRRGWRHFPPPPPLDLHHRRTGFSGHVERPQWCPTLSPVDGSRHPTKPSHRGIPPRGRRCPQQTANQTLTTTHNEASRTPPPTNAS